MNQYIPQKRHTVLMVDDEPSVLAALKRVLHREPYDILTAQSGGEALETLRHSTPSVIVVDERMPVMNGLTLLRHVKNDYPVIERIVLTGRADLQLALEAINDVGVARFFTKPCSGTELALAIRESIQRVELGETNVPNELPDIVHMQASYIEHLEREHPGISRVTRDAQGAVVADDDDP